MELYLLPNKDLFPHYGTESTSQKGLIPTLWNCIYFPIRTYSHTMELNLLPKKVLFPHYGTVSIHFTCIYESQETHISRCVTIYQHDCFLLKPKTIYPAPLSGLAHATQTWENSLVTSETSWQPRPRQTSLEATRPALHFILMTWEARTSGIYVFQISVHYIVVMQMIQSCIETFFSC